MVNRVGIDIEYEGHGMRYGSAVRCPGGERGGGGITRERASNRHFGAVRALGSFMRNVDLTFEICDKFVCGLMCDGYDW